MVAQDHAVIPDGPRVVAAGQVGVAAVHVGGDMLGVPLEDPGEIGDSLGVIAHSGVYEAALVAQLVVLGSQGDDFRQIGQGQVVPPQLAISTARMR